MRTLLFVASGDERPKCYRPRAQYDWAYLRRLIVGVEGSPGFSLAFAPSGVMEARAADRWWLVECESAEAGRQVIADKARFDADPTLKNLRGLGRILSSGGKKS